MSAQTFVLLFALVMEDQDLIVAAFLNHLADYARLRLRPGDFTLGTRDCQYIAELQLPISASARFFHSNYVTGGHPVLLPTGADDRVHTYASINSNPPRTPARLGNLQVCCLCLLFPQRFFIRECGPRTREPRTVPPVQANIVILSCVVEIGQTKSGKRDYSRVGNQHSAAGWRIAEHDHGAGHGFVFPRTCQFSAGTADGIIERGSAFRA